MTDDPEARTYAWADRLVREARRLGDVPRFGTEQWWALDPRDDRDRTLQLASLVIAAECWRQHTSTTQIAWDVLTDLAAGRRDLRQTSHDVAAADDWAAIAARPTHAELRRRRGEAA